MSFLLDAITAKTSINVMAYKYGPLENATVAVANSERSEYRMAPLSELIVGANAIKPIKSAAPKKSLGIPEITTATQNIPATQNLLGLLRAEVLLSFANTDRKKCIEHIATNAVTTGKTLLRTNIGSEGQARLRIPVKK